MNKAEYEMLKNQMKDIGFDLNSTIGKQMKKVVDKGYEDGWSVEDTLAKMGQVMDAAERVVDVVEQKHKKK
jgi:hypothetical protein